MNWETKQICQPHQPGQLLVIGPQVMPSYYKNPKATSEIIDSQGFVRTGFMRIRFYGCDGRPFAGGIRLARGWGGQ